jgi:hypothetical protein
MKSQKLPMMRISLTGLAAVLTLCLQAQSVSGQG